jgi:tRNA-2-methylthio-N6-dimethylallyladenosine synthase
LQMEHSLISNKRAVGKIHKVLIEGDSKRSSEHQCGRNTQNVMCVFPKKGHTRGDYVHVKVTECTAATLIGEIVE